eukprot:gene13406-6492_t
MLKRGRAPKHCPWGIELDASMKFTRCTLQSVAQGDDEMRACVGMTLTTINGQVPGADSTHPNSTTTGPGDANQTVACAADLVPSATSQDEKLVQKQAKAAPKDTGRKAQKLKAAEGSGLAMLFRGPWRSFIDASTTTPQGAPASSGPRCSNTIADCCRPGSASAAIVIVFMRT